MEAATPTVAMVERQLAHARGRLRSHGGDVRCVMADDGHVEVEFEGACRGCPAIAFTFGLVVEPELQQLSGIRTVSAPQVQVSAAALERIRGVTRTGRGPSS